MNNEKIDLKDFALKVIEGTVFTSGFHLNPNEMNLLPNIFLPLGFMSKEQILALDGKMLYEYYDKSLDRSVNGHPMFGSFRTMDKDDVEKVKQYIKEIEEWKKKL